MDTTIHGDLEAWLATLPPPEGSEDADEVSAGPVYVRRWLASDGPAPGPGVAILSQYGEPPRWSPLAAGEVIEDTETCAAAFAVSAAVYEARGGAPVVTVHGLGAAPIVGQSCAPAAPPLTSLSDEAWFDANPGRSCRIRPHHETDPLPYWAAEAGEVFTVVRVSSTDPRPRRQSVALGALGGVVPADSDEAALAALQASRLWRNPRR